MDSACALSLSDGTCPLNVMTPLSLSCATETSFSPASSSEWRTASETSGACFGVEEHPATPNIMTASTGNNDVRGLICFLTPGSPLSENLCLENLSWNPLNLVRSAFALRVSAAAVDIRPFFHRLAFRTAILFGRYAGTHRMLTLVTLFRFHS